MSKENSAGLGVNNFYGPRPTPDGAAGVLRTDGAFNELTIEFSGKNINDDVISGRLPAGAYPIEVFTEVEEVFSLGGTGPALEIGTDGSEATNGIQIAQADLQAVGAYTDTSFNGTWAARLAAETVVSAALSGTSPTITDAGFARVVIRYIKV